MVAQKDCIFCRIANGEIPVRKIYEDEDAIAFLDIHPANLGHTLIITKMHYEDIISCDEITARRIMGVVKRVCEKVRKELKTDSMHILENIGEFSGRHVAHLHFHVIPRYPGDDVKFEYPGKKMAENDIDRMQSLMKLD
ncbi:MAG: HIT family protein [Candidatus Aenigmatarchaeota archaeon]